jgi:hypothetical protein
VVDADTRQDAHHTSKYGWLGDQLEWMRGKVELLWDNRLASMFGRLGNAPRRLTGGRVVPPRMSRRSRQQAGTRFLWSWEEQGVRMLKNIGRVSVVAVITGALLIVLGMAAARVANAVSHNVGSLTKAPTPTPPSGSAITIRNASGGNATFPPAPEYTLGMWPSNQTPGVGSSTTIYARVSHLAAPVQGVPVSISFNGQSMTARTNQDGIAAFHINASGASLQPVVVSGSIRINGKEIDASTFYTPL